MVAGGQDFGLQGSKEANRILARDPEYLGMLYDYYSPVGHLSEDRIDGTLAKEEGNGISMDKSVEQSVGKDHMWSV